MIVAVTPGGPEVVFVICSSYQRARSLVRRLALLPFPLFVCLPQCNVESQLRICSPVLGAVSWSCRSCPVLRAINTCSRAAGE